MTKKFEITEIDRDYCCFVRSEIKEFKTLADANKWCTDNSWTGSDYFVTKELPPA